MDTPNLLKFDIEKDETPRIHFEGQKEPYYFRLNACDNPYCACGELNINILTQKNKNSSKSIGKIRVNVKTQKVCDSIDLEENSITSKWKQLFGAKQPQYKWDQLFASKLTQADWQLLYEFYLADKRIIIKSSDLHKKYKGTYEFSEQHIASPELRITFEEIFPECEPFFIEKNDKVYYIIAEYCKDMDCKCNDINVVLKNEDQELRDFEYNYVTGEISDTSYQWVIDEWEEEYEELSDRLLFRNNVIKVEYGRSLLALHTAEVAKYSNLVKQEIPKIGRNEPCFCGSGKKYKKCCMKKLN